MTPTLYVKGTFNGWGLDTPMQRVSDCLFITSLVLSADKHQFKITDGDSNTDWTFSGHPTKETQLFIDSTTDMIHTQGIGNDLVFSPNSSGRYIFTLDFSSDTPTLIVKTDICSSPLETNCPPFSYKLDNSSNQPFGLRSNSHALAPQCMFAQLAIEKTSSFSYVFGDNIDGYFEGQTYAYAGTCRYRHHQGWLFGGFGSFVNGQLNNQCSAKKALLLPYGVEHHYAKSQELVSVLQGQRALSLSLLNDTAAVLSFIPNLNINATSASLKHDKDVLLISIDSTICPEGCPRFVAISADQPIEVSQVNLHQHDNPEQTLFLESQNIQIQLATLTPRHTLTAYLCFEHDEKTAIDNARRLAQKNGLLEHQQKTYDFLTNNYLWTNDQEYNRAVMWSRLASRTFVNHEFGAGIWAGLPWFKDCWGRDTFIAMSGTSLVNGLFDEAKNIITNFASMQMLDNESVNFGRIPNRVTSKTNIIYNTTDGTPWMIREIFEYINYSGDIEFAKEIYPVVKRFIQGVEKNYLNEDGLLSHRAPDTWMDAKINGQIPWSPRGPKANDIQALWFESVQIAVVLAKKAGDSKRANLWKALTKKIKTSFHEKFWNMESKALADHLKADDKPNFSIRPNQLMTLTIPQVTPILTEKQGEKIVKQCVENLLFPWGICSLDQYHKDFHPYHDGNDNYHKDAAYHNGTIWGWNAGFTISALAHYNKQNFSYRLTKNLALQILNQGHLGTMSENLNAYQIDKNNLIETGTYAQAWSVSEYARNSQQDYLGFKPWLIDSSIKLTPKIPRSWTQCKARLPFGKDNAMFLEITRDRENETYRFWPSTPNDDLTLEICVLDISNIYQAKLSTKATGVIELRFIIAEKKWDVVHGEGNLVLERLTPSSTLEALDFCLPDASTSHYALEQKDYLLNKRKREKSEIYQD